MLVPPAVWCPPAPPPAVLCAPLWWACAPCAAPPCGELLPRVLVPPRGVVVVAPTETIAMSPPRGYSARRIHSLAPWRYQGSGHPHDAYGSCVSVRRAGTAHAVTHSPQQAFSQQSSGSGAAASRSRSHSSATNMHFLVWIHTSTSVHFGSTLVIIISSAVPVPVPPPTPPRNHLSPLYPPTHRPPTLPDLCPPPQPRTIMPPPVDRTRPPLPQPRRTANPAQLAINAAAHANAITAAAFATAAARTLSVNHRPWLGARLADCYRHRFHRSTGHRHRTRRGRHSPTQ